MASAQSATRDILDTYVIEMMRRGDGSHKGAEDGPLAEGVRAALDGVEAEAFLIVDLDGDPWILILTEAGIRLVRTSDGVVEVRFLGPLQGAYRERLSYDNAKGRVTVIRFEDDRLPGQVLELHQEVPLAHAVHVSQETRAQWEAIDALRPHLRRWAAVTRSPA
jgi:hypothetical protein